MTARLVPSAAQSPPGGSPYAFERGYPTAETSVLVSHRVGRRHLQRKPRGLFVGPTAPAGREGHSIKTSHRRGWFAYLRIYGPEQAAFDRTWKPGNFEELK